MRKRDTESDRQRSPQPILKHRLPSGRGAMEQPNATSDGETCLTPKFWLAVVLTGVATGLFGAALMAFLFEIQHLTFGYHVGDFQSAVARDSDMRRLAALMVAGVVGGVGWYLLGRFSKRSSQDLDDAVWNGSGELPVARSAINAVLSEVVIGMGASIGREAAPRLMGGVSGSFLSGWLNLTPAQRRLLVACGGGAGLAAVYNVPLGGALFTAEVLYGSLALPSVLPALVCSFVATSVAWIYLPNSATYIKIPTYHFSTSLMIWSLIIGPIIGLLAIFYVRLIGWVSHNRAKGKWLLIMPFAAFVVLGLLSFKYPELLGNGKDAAHFAFLGEGGLMMLFALFALKPLVTAMCLGSGASGGLFTPFLSTGALVGGFFGLAWTHAWPGTPVGAFAMVGAAAMIGASMQAPLVGLALVLELTHSGFALMVPMMAATAIATVLVRLVDGYSIYSARLPRREILAADGLASS